MRIKRKIIIRSLYSLPFAILLIFGKQIFLWCLTWYVQKNIENGSYVNKYTKTVDKCFENIAPNILSKYIQDFKDSKNKRLFIGACVYRKRKDMVPYLKEIAEKNIEKENFSVVFDSVCAIAALEEDIKLPELDPNKPTQWYNRINDYCRYLEKVYWAWDGRKETLEPLAREIAKNWKPSTSRKECEKLNGPLKPKITTKEGKTTSKGSGNP